MTGYPVVLKAVPGSNRVVGTEIPLGMPIVCNHLLNYPSNRMNRTYGLILLAPRPCNSLQNEGKDLVTTSGCSIFRCGNCQAAGAKDMAIL